MVSLFALSFPSVPYTSPLLPLVSGVIFEETLSLYTRFSTSYVARPPLPFLSPKEWPSRSRVRDPILWYKVQVPYRSSGHLDFISIVPSLHLLYSGRPPTSPLQISRFTPN